MGAPKGLRQPESPNVHIWESRRSKTPPKFNERTNKRGRKGRKLWRAREKKKERNFGVQREGWRGGGSSGGFAVWGSGFRVQGKCFSGQKHKQNKKKKWKRRKQEKTEKEETEQTPSVRLRPISTKSNWPKSSILVQRGGVLRKVVQGSPDQQPQQRQTQNKWGPKGRLLSQVREKVFGVWVFWVQKIWPKH